MPTSDISTITGYADFYHAGWGKKDAGSGWNQNSHVYCKRKLEVFTINLLPFGWGKTLALGFQMTALSPTPKPLGCCCFYTKQFELKMKTVCFLADACPWPAFVFHTEQIRKRAMAVECSWLTRETWAVSPLHSSHSSSYTGSGTQNSKVYSIICSLRDKAQISHMLSQYLTTQVHAHSSSNPKHKLGELWQTLLNSKQGGPFLSPFSWRLFFRAWTLN